MESLTLHVHAQWSKEKCNPEECAVLTQALGSYKTDRMRPEPWHCPTKAYGTLGGMDSLCANELFPNNDQTWFKE